MNKYITLLRGINVGGHRKILMADLKKMFSSLQAKNVVTYIQSGNIIFEHENENPNKLSSLISKSITQNYGFDVPVITFTTKNLSRAIKNNPFVKDNKTVQLHLTFLNELPEKKLCEEINKFNFGPDQFKIIEKTAYINCIGKYHQTKFSNQFFEKKLNITATTRNWKTVLKLNELANK